MGGAFGIPTFVLVRWMGWIVSGCLVQGGGSAHCESVTPLLQRLAGLCLSSSHQADFIRPGILLPE